MNKDLFKDIKLAFVSNTLIQLITINIIVFIVLNLIKFGFLFTGVSKYQVELLYNLYIGKYIDMPINFLTLIKTPYSVITHLFIHYNVPHILSNMLALWFFGRIFNDLLGQKKIWSLYILGGITGALIAIFILAIFPNDESTLYMIGASGAINAIIIATMTLAPLYIVRVIIIGDIELRYLGLFFIIINFTTDALFYNLGGSIAHLGGALFGYIFIKQLQRGNDFSMPFNKFFDWFSNLFSKKRKLNIAHSNIDKTPPKKVNSKQKELDVILDKISQSGYDSLTAAEKEFLFKYSNE